MAASPDGAVIRARHARGEVVIAEDLGSGENEIGVGGGYVGEGVDGHGCDVHDVDESGPARPGGGQEGRRPYGC
ncbi:hypothetical protein GCM10010211_71510 [Streptomyces albospinus]|uniref:Uncharacterized protein n=1 Tax=Streptomyces albospinus TaxID=285515 RepID=A0ABQ2VKI9_9ACTN|nr:hypothetical protein GCM10010211_71510 [Streptomyces albospinus]